MSKIQGSKRQRPLSPVFPLRCEFTLTSVYRVGRHENTLAPMRSCSPVGNISFVNLITGRSYMTCRVHQTSPQKLTQSIRFNVCTTITCTLSITSNCISTQILKGCRRSNNACNLCTFSLPLPTNHQQVGRIEQQQQHRTKVATPILSKYDHTPNPKPSQQQSSNFDPSSPSSSA